MFWPTLGPVTTRSGPAPSKNCGASVSMPCWAASALYMPILSNIILGLLNLTYGNALIQFNRADWKTVVKFRAFLLEIAQKTHYRSRSFQ